jgi:methylated-DNA-[protein]-cysteine S-methyltransferase
LAVTWVRYEVDSWGVGELWLDRGRVVWHESPRPRRPHPHPGWGATRRPLRPTIPGKSRRNGDDSASILVARLRAFFAGADVVFDDAELDLDGLSPFQRACASALRAVPRGAVVTYGELAALAGAPGAARAAGTFCARNPHSIFVPCHRVVSANGLGGYGDLGLDYKRRLLALEHALP